MTDEEMKRLEELAKKATPGPWFAGAWSGRCHVNHGGIHPGPPACRYDYLKTEAYGYVSAEQPGVSIVDNTTNGTAMAARDKGFVAAANPAAVLALLDRIEALEKQNTELAAFAENFATTVEAASAHAENDGKGMQVPFHGDFAGAKRFPSVLQSLCWWARAARDAMGERRTYSNMLKQAERKGAEEMRKAIVVRLRETARGYDEVAEMMAGDVKGTWDRLRVCARAWEDEDAAEDILTLRLPGDAP